MLRHTARPVVSLAKTPCLALVVALVGMLAGAGGAAAATVTEFSAGITPDSGPAGIAAGPDGNLWFTEAANRIGRITPSGTVTEFSSGITPGGEPFQIAAGSDGNLWFTDDLGNRIGRITPTGTVTEFSAGITPGGRPLDITAGPDGNLWFTDDLGNRIGRITPTGTVTEFAAGITPGSSPQGIAAGPDGNLWFTEAADRIGRITPSGTVTEFSSGITPGGEPLGIAAGPDGNLWFTEDLGNRIGRITPAGTVIEFSAGITPGGGPRGIAAGPDGNLWFTELLGNRIGRITTDVTSAMPIATALPKPVLGKLVNVQVVRGQVFVSQPAGKARASASVPGLKGRVFVALRGASQIPVRSLLDTRKGTVKLTSARDSTGTPQSSDFLGGVFQVLQSGKAGAKGLTEARLKGSSFSGCRVSTRRGRFKTRGRVGDPTVRGGRAAATRLSHRAVRRLRGTGSGRFRTRGRYSAATVRGTDWTVTDRCDGTLTKVKRGTVAVRDFRRKKTITVRAGKRYLARARR